MRFRYDQETKSFLQDGFSRRILGFVVAASKTMELVTRTVEQAARVRKRANPTFAADGVIVHSVAGRNTRP